MTTSTVDVEFKNFVQPCIDAFKRSRVTRFAKSNNVTNEEVHVHNQVPIWFLVKRFKLQNNIKSRLFKSLSEEQKQLWLNFYNENKQIILMTNEKHKAFHESNMFDLKSGTWKSLHVDDEKESGVNEDIEMKSKPSTKHVKKQISIPHDEPTPTTPTTPTKHVKKQISIPHDEPTPTTPPSPTTETKRKKVRVKKT